MKTTFMQSKETVNRTWYVIDAKDYIKRKTQSNIYTTC